MKNNNPQPKKLEDGWVGNSKKTRAEFQARQKQYLIDFKSNLKQQKEIAKKAATAEAEKQKVQQAKQKPQPVKEMQRTAPNNMLKNRDLKTNHTSQDNKLGTKNATIKTAPKVPSKKATTQAQYNTWQAPKSKASLAVKNVNYSISKNSAVKFTKVPATQKLNTQKQTTVTQKQKAINTKFAQVKKFVDLQNNAPLKKPVDLKQDTKINLVKATKFSDSKKLATNQKQKAVKTKLPQVQKFGDLKQSTKKLKVVDTITLKEVRLMLEPLKVKHSKLSLPASHKLRPLNKKQSQQKNTLKKGALQQEAKQTNAVKNTQAAAELPKLLQPVTQQIKQLLEKLDPFRTKFLHQEHQVKAVSQKAMADSLKLLKKKLCKNKENQQKDTVEKVLAIVSTDNTNALQSSCEDYDEQVSDNKTKLLLEKTSIIEKRIDVQSKLDNHTQFNQLVEYAIKKPPQDLNAKKTKQSEKIIKYSRKHQIAEPTTAKSTLNKVEDVQHYNNNSPIVPFDPSNHSYAPTSLSLVSNKPENAETCEAVTSYLKNKQKAVEPQKTQITTPTTLDIKKSYLREGLQFAYKMSEINLSNHHLALETLTFIGKGFEKYKLKNAVMGIIANYLGVNTYFPEYSDRMDIAKSLPKAITANHLYLLNKNTAIDQGIAKSDTIQPLISAIRKVQWTSSFLKQPAMELIIIDTSRTFVYKTFKAIKKDVKNHLEANTKNIVAQVLDSTGNSLVHKLIVHHNVNDKLSKLIGRLLDEGGAKVNQKNDQDYTALHLTLFPSGGEIWFPNRWNFNQKLFDLLINKGADVNAITHEGKTPLYYAIANGLSKEIVQLLINKGADVNAITNNQETLLHCAANTCNVEILKLLIDTGRFDNAAINSKNQQNNTALDILEAKSIGDHQALEDNIVIDAMEILINAGGAPGINKFYSLGKIRNTIEKYLVSKMTPEQINKPYEGKGSLMLNIALLKRNIHLVKMLLDKGANVLKPDDQGKTALKLATDEQTKYPNMFKLINQASERIIAAGQEVQSDIVDLQHDDGGHREVLGSSQVFGVEN